jgi:hypothetical protein
MSYYTYSKTLSFDEPISHVAFDLAKVPQRAAIWSPWLAFKHVFVSLNIEHVFRISILESIQDLRTPWRDMNLVSLVVESND